MNPVELIIKGLNSFAEEQRIDFRKLTRHGIFGIFGPTGSGKTTIIDAITIALYDKIPRMDKERSIKQAFNVNSDEIYISFSFSIHTKTEQEELVYTVERAYKKTQTGHKVVTARLYKKSGQTVVMAEKPEETTKKINEIIGLTYDDFIRSVILPQGKFSEFLFLANKERRAMLERIFRLEKYGERLNINVRQKYNDCKNEIILTDSQIEILGGTSAEAIQKETSVYNVLTAELVKNKNELASKQAEHEQIKKLCETQKEYEKYLFENEKLQAKRDYMNVASDKLIKNEKAEKVLPLVKQRKEIEQKLENITAEKLKLESEHEINQKKYEKAQSKYLLALQDKDEKYPELLQRQTKLIEAVKLAESKKALEKQRECLINEYTGLKKSYDDAQKRVSALETELNGYDTELLKLEEDKSKIYIEPQTKQKIEEGYETEKKTEDLLKDIKLLIEKIKKYQENYEKKSTYEEQFGKDIAETEKALIKAKRFEEGRLAYKLAASLEDGKPCMVCGSVSHPCVARPETDEIEADILLLEAKLDKLREKKASLSGELLSDKKIAEENEAMLKELQNEYNKTVALLEALKIEMKIESFNKVLKNIKENEKEADKLAKNEKLLRTERDNKQRLLTEIKNKLNEDNARLSAIMTSGKEKREAIQNLQDQITRLTQKSTGDPEKELALTDEETKKIILTEKNAKTTFAEIETKKQKTYENLLENIKLEEANKSLAAEFREKLSVCLAEQGFINEDEALSYIVADKDSLKAEINEYNDRLKLIAGNIERLSEILKGQQGIAQKAEELKNELSILESAVKQMTEQAAITGERIRRMSENLEKAEALAIKKKNLNRSLDIFEDLAKLFAGNYFVEYIAKRQLKNIAAETSRRLSRMTCGRYALELDDTDFVIQDNFNGGIRRSPKTLSGGETFLVSLCLALALSAKVQLTQSAPLQLFFLDEGFGTLDPGLLDTVMDTLEKLRLENLNVGVITHVEELKNRIPARLIVEPAVQGVRGTRVVLEGC